MPRDVFSAFAQTLEEKLGTPEGVTNELVIENMEEIYNEILDGIQKYSYALNFQSKNYDITYSFRNTDRIRQTTTLAIIVEDKDNKPVTIPISLTKEKITATAGYLQTAAPDGGGVWGRDEQDDFIERLGFAIMLAIGIQI